jgi:hypothetical protein
LASRVGLASVPNMDMTEPVHLVMQKQFTACGKLTNGILRMWFGQPDEYIGLNYPLCKDCLAIAQQKK